MRRKVTSKRVTSTLRFSSIFDDNGQHAGGGILNPTGHTKSEAWVQIMDDPVFDRATEQEGVTGRLQIHLGASRRAMKELGVLFLSLANYRPPKTGYHLSVDLTDQHGKPAVQLVVHSPVKKPDQRPNFLKIHNVSTWIVTPKGEWHETTLPAVHPANKRKH